MKIWAARKIDPTNKPCPKSLPYIVDRNAITISCIPILPGVIEKKLERIVKMAMRKAALNPIG